MDWRRGTSVRLLDDLLGGGKRKGVVLTAHHKDDVEEMALLKLLWGVHLANVVGMEVLRPAYEAEDEGRGGGKGERVYFVKPMLLIRKSEIMEFMAERGLEWREDTSNESDKHVRNRVREEARIYVGAVERRFGCRGFGYVRCLHTDISHYVFLCSLCRF